MDLEQVAKTYEVREGGALLSQIGFDFTVFTQTSVFEEATRNGVLDFYSQVLERFGSTWTFYETEAGGLRKVDERAKSLLQNWLPDPKTTAVPRRRQHYMLRFRDGTKEDDIGTVGFECQFFGKESRPGFLRLRLPLSAGNEPQNLIALVESLVRRLPIASGRAGFALQWNESSTAHYQKGLRHAEWLSQWYHGVDLPDDTMTLFESPVTEFIRPPGWLTLLGLPLVDRLGGLSALRAAFQAPILVRELPHAVLIQAGPAPQTGNSPRPDDLETYRIVARVLAPIRMKTHKPIVEDMDGWLARFEDR